MSTRATPEIGLGPHPADATRNGHGHAGSAISAGVLPPQVEPRSGGLRRFLHSEPAWSSTGIVLLVLRALAELAKPLPLAYAIAGAVDEDSLGRTEIANLAWAAGFVVAFTLLERVFRYLAGVAFRRAARGYAASVRRAVFERSMLLQLFGESPPSGRTSLSRELVSLQSAFGDNFRQTASALLLLAGIGAVAIYIDRQTGSLIIALGVAFFVLMRRHAEHVLRSGGEGSLESRPETPVPWSMDFLAAAAVAAVLVTAGYRAQQGFLGAGQLFVLLYYTQALFGVLRTGVQNGVALRHALLAAESLTTTAAPGEPKGEKGARAPQFKGDVELREIAVGVNQSLRTTIHVPAGAVTAIERAPRTLTRGVVMSVMRYGEPGGGTVRIDGRDTSRYRGASVRGQVGVLLREPVLLETSIAENIACGRDGLRASDVETAAQMAGAHEFVVELPQGYETQLGDVRDRLTPAERQLIAIARLAAQDPSVLILEEPTYRLGHEQAEPVVLALKRLLQGRTALLMTNDRELLDLADHRIRLEGGSLTGDEVARPAPAGQRPDDLVSASPVTVAHVVSRVGPGAFETLLSNPYKLFDLTRQQFERLLKERPELLVIDDDCGVVGFPYRDYLVIHYSFADRDAFIARFPDLFRRCVAASGRHEARRGAVVHFHDKSSRPKTDPVFASLRFAEGPEWARLVLKQIPMPVPSRPLPRGHDVREATFEDLAAIGELELAAGQKPLTVSGLMTLAQESRTGQIVTDGNGKTVGFFNLRMGHGSVAMLEPPLLHPSEQEKLAEPVLYWSLGWFCEQGAFKVAVTVDANDGVMLRALASAGFEQTHAGLTYRRELA